MESDSNWNVHHSWWKPRLSPLPSSCLDFESTVDSVIINVHVELPLKKCFKGWMANVKNIHVHSFFYMLITIAYIWYSFICHNEIATIESHVASHSLKKNEWHENRRKSILVCASSWATQYTMCLSLCLFNFKNWNNNRNARLDLVNKLVW